MVFLDYLNLFGDICAFKVRRGDEFFILKTVRFHSGMSLRLYTNGKFSINKTTYIPPTARGMHISADGQTQTPHILYFKL